MQTGDFWRSWDGERWYFGRCRQHDEMGLTVQWFGYGNKRCYFPYRGAGDVSNRKFIEAFIANVEIIE